MNIENKSSKIEMDSKKIEIKSMRYSIIVFLCVSMILIVIDRINNIFSPQHLIAFLFFLITSRLIFYKYTRKKIHLMLTIIFIIALAATITEYIDILI